MERDRAGGTTALDETRKSRAAAGGKKRTGMESWEAYLADIMARTGTRWATLTPIRRTVLELLFRHPRGLKAYDLLALVRAERDNATPPTVYRALDFLMAQGFAHKIGRNSLFVACRHASHQWPSLFLVCPRCRAVTDLQDAALMQTLAATLEAAGFLLDGPEVEISAVCPACGTAKERAENSGRAP